MLTLLLQELGEHIRPRRTLLPDYVLLGLQMETSRTISYRDRQEDASSRPMLTLVPWT